LPNLIWQWQHQFISLEFLSYLHARDSGQGRYNGFFPEQFLVCVNPVTVPLTLMGLWFYLVDKNNKRYCLLGWVFVITFTLFSLAQVRSYYAAPLYPMLIAGGSVFFGQQLDKLRPKLFAPSICNPMDYNFFGRNYFWAVGATSCTNWL